MEKDNSSQSSQESFIQFFSNLFQLAIGIAAFSSAVGYVTLSRLFTYWSIYNIDPLTSVYPQQLLAWGLIFLIYYFMHYVIPFLLVLLLLCVVLALITLRRDYKGLNLLNKSIDTACTVLMKILFSHLVGRILWIVVAVFAFYFAINAENYLPQVTSPTKEKVIIIFTEDINPDLWHVSVDPKNPRSTQPVTLVMSLTDSLLIRDNSTGAVVSIKNDMISGIINNASSIVNPSVSPTLSPSLVP